MRFQVLAERLRNRKSKPGSERRLATPSAAQFRLNVERLEPRLLLYAASGGAWPHPELVTASFMPDGTDMAGLPSALFSTMNARWSTATWQKEMLRGLQSYAANANINFSVASDDGSAFGSAGTHTSDNNMQGDQDFGDIRIGAVNLGVPLGEALLPPPISPDTTAGDFQLNSTSSWNIGSSFDLFTVSAHEEGHSVGLCHSADSTAVMFDTYNAVKSALTSDDILGIQAIYGVRPQDQFDTIAPNNTKGTATQITSYIDSNKQVTLTGLDITNASDTDWYHFTTPGGSANTMIVQMQSSKLSLLAPSLSLYKNDGTLISTVTGSYNSTVTLTRSISSGQKYYIKTDGADTSVFGIGAYALQINMGTSTLPAVNSPNTATPSNGSGQSPCAIYENDGAHDVADPGSEDASHGSVTVITGGETGNSSSEDRHDAKPTIHKDPLQTNFDIDRTPLSRIGLVSGQMTQLVSHPRAGGDVDTMILDHLLEDGLADSVHPALHSHARVN